MKAAPPHAWAKVWPLPRAAYVVSVALLALALAAPGTVGAQWVPDVIQGAGTATTFQLFAEGLAIEGGLYQWTDICGWCHLRMTIGPGLFLVVDEEGIGRQLAPGEYEIREYRGLFAFSSHGPHQFTVELHGVGKVLKLS